MANMVNNPEVEFEDATRSRLELKNLQRKFEECFMEGQPDKKVKLAQDDDYKQTNLIQALWAIAYCLKDKAYDYF